MNIVCVLCIIKQFAVINKHAGQPSMFFILTSGAHPIAVTFPSFTTARVGILLTRKLRPILSAHPH